MEDDEDVNVIDMMANNLNNVDVDKEKVRDLSSEKI